LHHWTGGGRLKQNLPSSQVDGRILEHVIVKLLGIVKGDFSQNTEAVDNVLPEKLLDCGGAYVGHWLFLDPLCEILGCYNGEGVIALS
jgi:hypothetical protein